MKIKKESVKKNSLDELKKNCSVEKKLVRSQLLFDRAHMYNGGRGRG